MVDLAKTLAANGKLVYEGKPISAEDSLKSGIAPYIPSPELVNAVNLTIYLEKRPQKMEKGKAGKKASTSELLDWFAVLQQFPEDEILQELESKIPFPEVLLKKWEDHLRYLNYEA